MANACAADGTKIAYRVRGQGAQTVLLLHAWGASGRYFDETIDNLDLSGDRAIAIDIRGHGDSGKPDSPLSWELLACDVLAVADAVGAERFVAVGHSMGGKLAQYLPLVAPDRVQGPPPRPGRQRTRHAVLPRRGRISSRVAPAGRSRPLTAFPRSSRHRALAPPTSAAHGSGSRCRSSSVSNASITCPALLLRLFGGSRSRAQPCPVTLRRKLRGP